MTPSLKSETIDALDQSALSIVKFKISKFNPEHHVCDAHKQPRYPPPWRKTSPYCCSAPRISRISCESAALSLTAPPSQAYSAIRLLGAGHIRLDLPHRSEIFSSFEICTKQQQFAVPQSIRRNTSQEWIRNKGPRRGHSRPKANNDGSLAVGRAPSRIGYLSS